MDSSEFRQFARKADLELHPFDVSPGTIALARHIYIDPKAKLVCRRKSSTRATREQVMLGHTLEFDGERSGLPLDFALQQPDPASDGFAFVRSDIDGEVMHFLNLIIDTTWSYSFN